jgi:hypothetical protein
MGKTQAAFVIAHFHPQGRVPLDLINLVRHLHERSERVVFVSTRLATAQVAILKSLATVIVRENVGYDFWSYKVGIEALGDLSGFQRVVILNSSFITYDPDRLCEPFLGECRQPGIRGLTMSHEIGRHVQSFWVSFEHPDLLRSDDFRHWWNAMQPVSEREEVIRRYEIGMSAHFTSLGVPLTAEFSPTPRERLEAISREVVSGRWKPRVTGPAVGIDLAAADRLNPSMCMWRPLLERHGIVKVATVRWLAKYSELEQLLRGCSDTDVKASLTADAIGPAVFAGPRALAPERSRSL